MEKRTILCLAAVLLACAGTGVVHGWPWSSKKTTELSVEIKNKKNAPLYCIYGNDETEIRQGTNQEEVQMNSPLEFKIDTEYPPLFWISNEGFTGSGRWYAIDPQKYPTGKVRLEVSKYGELLDLVFPGIPVRDRGYEGGVIYGGTLTRQEQKSEPKIINMRDFEVYLENQSGFEYHYAKAQNEDGIHKAYPSNIRNHDTYKFTTKQPCLWVGRGESGPGMLLTIDQTKYPQGKVQLKIGTDGKISGQMDGITSKSFTK